MRRRITCPKFAYWGSTLKLIWEVFEIRLFKLRAVAKELLISCEIKTVPDSKPSMNIPKQTGVCGIKLTAINLPTFDDNYSNWRSFGDTSSAFVDRSDSLTNVQILCYLRSQLSVAHGTASKRLRLARKTMLLHSTSSKFGLIIVGVLFTATRMRYQTPNSKTLNRL